MTRTLSISAYWTARKEALSECALRLDQFLESLGDREPLLKYWYNLGRSRATATTPIGVGVNELAATLMRGQNRRDVDGSVISELGFRFGAWNNQQGKGEASLSIKCGLYDQTAGLSNAVNLRLPCIPGYEAPGRVIDLLHVTVKAWEPFTAVVRTDQALEQELPCVDWICCSRFGFHADRLPKEIRTLDWGPLGQCVVLQDHPVDWSDDVEASRANMLRSAIRSAPPEAA